MATVPSGTVYLGKAGFKPVELTGNWSVPLTEFYDFENPPSSGSDDRTDLYALEGTYSNAHTIEQAAGYISPNNGFVGMRRDLYRGEQIWFQIHLLHPPGWEYVSLSKGERNKFMRIHTFDGSGADNGHNDIYVGNPALGEIWRYIYEGIDEWVDFGVNQSDLPQDNEQWEEYQLSVVLDTLAKDQGGKGEVFFWKNDELKFHLTSKKTLVDNDGWVGNCNYNNFWSNNGAEKTQTCYWDVTTVTNQTPEYTDSQGNPKLPPRNI